MISKKQRIMLRKLRKQRRSRTKHKFNKAGGPHGLRLGSVSDFDERRNTITIDEVSFSVKKNNDSIVIQDQRFQTGDLVKVGDEYLRVSNVIREPLDSVNRISAWRYKFSNGIWKRDIINEDEPMRLVQIENEEHTNVISYLESIGESGLANRVRNLRNS